MMAMLLREDLETKGVQNQGNLPPTKEEREAIPAHKEAVIATTALVMEAIARNKEISPRTITEEKEIRIITEEGTKEAQTINLHHPNPIIRE